MARAVLIVENADLWNAWANSALKGAFQSQQFLPTSILARCLRSPLLSRMRSTLELVERLLLTVRERERERRSISSTIVICLSQDQAATLGIAGAPGFASWMWQLTPPFGEAVP